MKTILKREFLRRPSMVSSLRPGERLLVTVKGEADFVVLKAGRRPPRSTAELERLAVELLPGERRTLNVVERLRDLRA